MTVFISVDETVVDEEKAMSSIAGYIQFACEKDKKKLEAALKLM